MIQDGAGSERWRNSFLESHLRFPWKRVREDDAERQRRHSHAEHGNEGSRVIEHLVLGDAVVEL